MRSPLQQAILVSIAEVLKPIARLLLQGGIGCAEFVAMAKTVFVEVATEEFGLRGRPTNVSRVAAMTGLSRKEVSRIRAETGSSRWTPKNETTPGNVVIHYWHYDPEFSKAPGEPDALPFEGHRSFTSLVRRYAGDIPAGAMRKELCRAGTIAEESGMLAVRERYFFPVDFHEDFIRNIAFSLRNLASTVVYNASLVRRPDVSGDLHNRLGRFERCAWTENLTEEATDDFRAWARRTGTSFIEGADHWIGRHELPRDKWEESSRRVVGVGIYFFEEDQ